jgi:hypothetical protein
VRVERVLHDLWSLPADEILVVHISVNLGGRIKHYDEQTFQHLETRLRLEDGGGGR